MLGYTLSGGGETLKRIFGEWSNPSPDQLPNLKIIEAHELWRSFISHGPREYAWCGQTRWKEWGTMLLFYEPAMFHAGGGFAIWQTHSYPPKSPVYLSWVQCDHDWHSKTIGNCLTQYTCQKCKHVFDIDSSG